MKIDFDPPNSGLKPQTIPRAFLENVVNFDILRLSILPSEVEWNTLGLLNPKFNKFYVGCDSNVSNWCNESVVTRAVTDNWRTAQCEQIDSVELCSLCFMQFYGLKLETDNVEHR